MCMLALPLHISLSHAKQASVYFSGAAWMEHAIASRLSAIDTLKSFGALNVLHVKVLTNGALYPAAPSHPADQHPSNASCLSGIQWCSTATCRGLQGQAVRLTISFLETNDQAVSSRAAVTAPPVQHALPPLIQQLLSRTANRSPQASAVGPCRQQQHAPAILRTAITPAKLLLVPQPSLMVAPSAAYMHQMQSHLCCQCLWRPQPASRASLNLAASARTWGLAYALQNSSPTPAHSLNCR